MAGCGGELMMQQTHMRTASGQPIWYEDPSKTVVCWQDLAAGLVRQRRYAGALNWSIAQHLALCVELARLRGYSDRLVALCAAHDLHEAYTLDLPKGLKECLPGYWGIEAAWEKHVHQWLGLEVRPEDEALIKAVDVRALAVEMACLDWQDWEPAQGVLAASGGAVTEAERRFVRHLDWYPEARTTMAIVRGAIEPLL